MAAWQDNSMVMGSKRMWMRECVTLLRCYFQRMLWSWMQQYATVQHLLAGTRPGHTIIYKSQPTKTESNPKAQFAKMSLWPPRGCNL